MKHVLLPLPQIDFDPTETAVPFSQLRAKGYRITVATPTGTPGAADPRMLTGEGLGPLAPFLIARSEDRQLYQQMLADDAFQNPRKYEDLRADDYDALVLPGGHAKGMRPYLESEVLQRLVARFFLENRPVAAICHGVLLAARSRHPDTGHSVLQGRRTTALLRSQEMLAWNLTRLWLGDYYRTYPTPLQTEVESLLASPDHFVAGPLPVSRDRFSNLNPGFTFREGNYLSARWPGDAHKFAVDLLELLS